MHEYCTMKKMVDRNVSNIHENVELVEVVVQMNANTFSAHRDN